MKTGILLVNVGTPDDPSPEKVKEYLDEFLMDPDVIDLPWPARWLLVKKFITPRRSQSSSDLYKKIWSARGSPLKYHSEDLRDRLAAVLGERYVVDYAMRYRNPSIVSVLKSWKRLELNRVLVVPLYPQYSLSSTASCEKEVARAVKSLGFNPPVKSLPPFYRDSEFIGAYAGLVAPALEGADHLLFSFHGLPVKQIKKMDSSHSHCLNMKDCCAQISSRNEKYCYRAQSFETARRIARELGWPDAKYSVSFQSRLTKNWIQPFTDDVIPRLARHDVRKLVVVCPSFTTDCLETLEEVGMRAKEQFLESGGEELRAIPCLNAEPEWVEGLSKMILRS